MWDAGPDERARHKLHMTNSNVSSLCCLIQYTYNMRTHTAETSCLYRFSCNVESIRARHTDEGRTGSYRRVVSAQGLLSDGQCIVKEACCLFVFILVPEEQKTLSINLLLLIVQQRAVAKVFLRKSCFHDNRVMAQ